MNFFKNNNIVRLAVAICLFIISFVVSACQTSQEYYIVDWVSEGFDGERVTNVKMSLKSVNKLKELQPAEDYGTIIGPYRRR